MKKILVILGALILTVGITAYAAEPGQSQRANPGRGFGSQIMAQITSKLTGMSLEEVLSLRQSGKSYYEIATSKGVSAEKFKDEVYNEKAQIIDSQVKNGYLTPEQGETAKNNIKTNIENCNGTGYLNQGGGQGLGLGRGQRGGMGPGQGRGFGNCVNLQNPPSK